LKRNKDVIQYNNNISEKPIEYKMDDKILNPNEKAIIAISSMLNKIIDLCDICKLTPKSKKPAFFEKYFTFEDTRHQIVEEENIENEFFEIFKEGSGYKLANITRFSLDRLSHYIEKNFKQINQYQILMSDFSYITSSRVLTCFIELLKTIHTTENVYSYQNEYINCEDSKTTPRHIHPLKFISFYYRFMKTSSRDYSYSLLKSITHDMINSISRYIYFKLSNENK
jgi:hypothetical protein